MLRNNDLKQWTFVFTQRKNVFPYTRFFLLIMAVVGVLGYPLTAFTIYRAIFAWWAWAHLAPAAYWSPSLRPWCGMLVMVDDMWLLPEAQRSCFWCLSLDACLWNTMPTHHPRRFAPIYRFLVMTSSKILTNKIASFCHMTSFQTSYYFLIWS